MAKERALRKLNEAVRAAEKGDGKEAFEDLSAARFNLFDEDCYTDPLVSAFDDALDIAWRLWQGRINKENAASQIRRVVERIKNLIEKPRGDKATPPRAVKSERDARLWDYAKWHVSEEYPDVSESSERFWELVTGVFRRMKTRIGGLPREKAEKILRELKEKYGGRLPQVGRGSKAEKEVERLKRQVVREMVKALLARPENLRNVDEDMLVKSFVSCVLRRLLEVIKR